MMTSPAVLRVLDKIKKKLNGGRDETSLSFLVKRDISQSACVRLGIKLENIVNARIVELLSPDWDKTIRKTETGEMQKDILFKNNVSKTFVYGELKGNLELDTEKIKATLKKVKNINDELISSGYTGQSFLISGRYLATSDIPDKKVKKCMDDGITLIGLRDFMAIMLPDTSCDPELLDYDMYSAMLGEIAGRLE